ncbi:circadian-associated transcriptional repressor [Spea bombifrons]|uniref:circadian-associated transcriptional repressor n=1 Tax=Spea bombifrons TaxID=233779 RepID=UPI00234B24F0|nr:circadian-associated transcriptional repressor [Spea bombifrons]
MWLERHMSLQSQPNLLQNHVSRPCPVPAASLMEVKPRACSLTVDSVMEDTESSDFLSSCDSLYSAESTTTGDKEHENYDFDVFLSGGLERTPNEEAALGSVGLISNSRLNTMDHPALIRLENEYQARRSYWQRSGQCFGCPQDTEGRISYDNHPGFTGSRSPPSTRNEEKPMKLFACSGESNSETHQGLKRQRNREAEEPGVWWKETQSASLSEGDRLFAQKCRELHGFIKPLTDLLNGLKKGRYDRGLSTFQQSVAMDRIQRIVGVLQKPEMGERYLGTLLQVEMMLKIWFPGVTSSSSASSSSDCDMEEPQYKIAKHPNVDSADARSCPSSKSPSARSHTEENPTRCSAADSSPAECVGCKEHVRAFAELPSMNLTWMHSAPICNPPVSPADLRHLNRAFGQEIFGPNASNCGVILLLHNGAEPPFPLARSASTTRPEQPASVIRHTEEITEERPLRSRSAPAALLTVSRPGLIEAGGRSRSLPRLPLCAQKPSGEKT